MVGQARGEHRCDNNLTFKVPWLPHSHSFFLTEKPDKLIIQRVGDDSADITASAGEDLEMECISTGGNPPPKLRWYADDQEIHAGHTQEDTRPEGVLGQPPGAGRTWTSISRLVLPVSKSDDGSTVRCEAEHPALSTPLSAYKLLTIHCRSKLLGLMNI